MLNWRERGRYSTRNIYRYMFCYYVVRYIQCVAKVIRHFQRIQRNAKWILRHSVYIASKIITFCGCWTGQDVKEEVWTNLMYKVVQIWPGLFVCKSGDISPGHIWTILYNSEASLDYNLDLGGKEIEQCTCVSESNRTVNVCDSAQGPVEKFTYVTQNMVQ